jgi:1,4-alpha-glucan branching enzyme
MLATPDKIDCGAHVLRIDRDRAGAVRVTFVLRPDEPRGRVSVVGDFNEWRPGVHELRPRSNGTRSVAVTVPDGTAMRFRYLGEDGHWCNETEHPEMRQVGADSLITANPPGRKSR